MSAAPGRARMDVLLESQHRRQRILDHLNGIARAAAADATGATPGSASVLQISRALGERHKLVIGTLALMRARHEVASSGAQLAVRYVALVATTVSAQTMYDAIKASKQAKAAEAKAADAPAPVNHEPWRTVHKGGEGPPIKNPGGQGSLRRTVYVNCQQHY